MFAEGASHVMKERPTAHAVKRYSDWRLWCGVAGPLLVVSSIVVVSFLKPSVSLWRQSISLLSEGPHGLIERIGFILGGLLTFVFADALRQVWGRYRVVIATQRVMGIGLVAVGVFIQQGLAPPHQFHIPSPWGALTFIGILHILASGVLYVAIIVSGLAVTRPLRDSHSGRSAALYSTASALAILLLLPAFIVAAALNGPSGLLERLVGLIAAIWQVWLTRTAWTRQPSLRDDS
jgi:hypothetical membrane protein